MTVRELINQLQECNPDAIVTINEKDALSMVWKSNASNKVDLTSCPLEEEVEAMSRYDVDALPDMEEYANGFSEVLDSMFINRAR